LPHGESKKLHEHILRQMGAHNRLLANGKHWVITNNLTFLCALLQ